MSLNYYYNNKKVRKEIKFTMNKDIEKYAAAKTIFGFNFLANGAKSEDGTIDKVKLDQLLKEKYEYIRRKNSKKKRNFSRIV